MHVLGATTNPNGPRVTQMARNFASDLEDAGRRFRFCIRDRDTNCTRSFDEVFASIGIKQVPTLVRSHVRTRTQSTSSAPSAKGASTILSSSYDDTSARCSTSTSAPATRRDRTVACGSLSRFPTLSRRSTAATSLVVAFWAASSTRTTGAA
ncbi:MAG TPA: hypothetical protein VNG12_16375 [Acidimicrobiales bacterium]|nr:hypothetical protein [Acidimicrobiales bacterium]